MLRRLLLATSVAALLLSSAPAFAQTTVLPYDATCSSLTMPAKLDMGQTFTAVMAFKNTGSKTWQPGSDFVQFINSPWSPTDTKSILTSVAKNGLAAVTFTSSAPNTMLGDFDFQWRMGHADAAGRINFGKTCSKTVKISGPFSDLSATVTAPAQVQKGSQYTYTVAIKNAGPLAATNVSLSMPIPAGASFMTASTGCSTAAGTLRCAKIGTIGVNATKTITINYSTSQTACYSALTTNAYVVGSQAEYYTENNTSASVQTEVLCPGQEQVVLTQSAGPVASTVIANQKDVSALTLVAKSINFDSRLNKIVLEAQQGNLASFQNYTLWVDTDNDTVVDTKLQSGVAAASSKVTFDALVNGGLPLLKNVPVKLEVRADAAAAFLSSSLQLKIATTTAGYIVAERASNGVDYVGIKTNGVCASKCEMTVTTVPSTIFTLVSQGNLSVFQSATPVAAKQYLVGQLGDDAARITFAADKESADVTVIRASFVGQMRSVDRLELFKVGETTPFANATVAGCQSDIVPAQTMCARLTNAELVVPVGQKLDIIARPRIKQLYDGAVAGDQFALKIGTGSVSARGVTTMNTITPVIVGFTSATHTVITPAPVKETELFVTMLSNGSLNTAVKNQKNISLASFDLRAANEQILVSELSFSAAQGELTNAQNYALWIDTDGDNIVDTIVQNGINAVAGKVTFTNVHILNAGQTVRFEVHADIASSLASNLLQLRIATDSADYVLAERNADGSPLTGIKTDNVCSGECEIAVATTASTVWKLVSQGDLYISQSSTPVRSHQLLGGTLGDEILRLQLHSEVEDIDVTSLVFTGSGAQSLSSNVSRLELYKVGETTAFAVATVAGCGSATVPANSMCAPMQSSQLVVPKATTTQILVRPRIKTDTDGAVSGQRVAVKVDAVLGATARGLFSSNNLAQNDADAQPEGEVFIGVTSPMASLVIRGSDNVVVLSKVTSITNADPNANGTAIPTGIANIGQFKFSAANHMNSLMGNNKVMFDGLIFNVNASNVNLDGSSFKLFNKADASTLSSCSVNQTSGSSALVVTCDNLSSFIDSQIDPGADMTFVLRAEVQHAKVNSSQPSTLQTALLNFNNKSFSTFSATHSHVKFFDKDAGSFVQFLWIEYPDAGIFGTQYNG